MLDGGLERLQDVVRAEGPARALDLAIEQFRNDKNYTRWFEACMVRTRLELGLPLMDADAALEMPPDVRAVYDKALEQAARETGELFLAAGDLPNAWVYLRAIGDSDRMAQALESADPGEDPDAAAAIALQEGVHPVRGLELILNRYGICRALSAFGMYNGEKDREKCVGFLARNIHSEIVQRIGIAVERAEGAKPESDRIPELIAGRGWLFGEFNTYVDTSHLVSILHFAPEIRDPAILELCHEFCEYGKHLHSNFQIAGRPPFEDFFRDVDHYVLASAGLDVEPHLEHFREKSVAEETGTLHAQALVRLLLKLDRMEEALDAALKYFPAAPEMELACPTAMQLCRLAGRYDRLMELALEQQDWLTYVAARLEMNRRSGA
jgi:hypothetical protein